MSKSKSRRMTLKARGRTHDIVVRVGKYYDGSPSLVATKADSGTPFSRFTLHYAGLPEKMVLLSFYPETKAVPQQLHDAGVIKLTGEYIGDFPLAKILI